jgi:hypothetical protein
MQTSSAPAVLQRTSSEILVKSDLKQKRYESLLLLFIHAGTPLTLQATGIPAKTHQYSEQ